MDYAERAHLFGVSDNLFGIHCRGTGPEHPDEPVVLMVSAGLIHRVGPNRTYAHLARALAEQGVPSFRFDLSGIGDSDRREGVSSLQKAVAHDIAEAVAFVKSLDSERPVVLLGICSGAFDAVESGLADPRITGIVPIDPQGSFRTPRHTAVHYVRRMATVSSWRNALRNPAQTLRAAHQRIVGTIDERGIDTGESSPTLVRGGVRPRYSRRGLGDKLDEIIEAELTALFVFTEGLEENYGYEDQFRDCYPVQCKHPSVGHAFIPGSDHTFTRRADRDALVELVSAWIKATRF